MDTREQNPEELGDVIEAKITLTSHLYHYHWLEADDFGRLLADEDP